MKKEQLKTKDLHIRIAENDLEIIRAKALSSYMTVTDFVEGLDEVVRQQKYLGNNLNQLTKIANSGTAEVINLNEVKTEYAKVTEKLNDILERGRWR